MKMRSVVVAGLVLATMQVAQAEPVTDFFRAVQLDNATYLKQLLKDVDANTKDPISGETGLILAMREGSQQVFDVLVVQPGIDLEQTAPNGNTALMMAAFKHHKAAVKTLLDKGAVVNRPGWTALHYAAASGDQEITRMLLERKANIDSPSPSGITPLMIAAREGQEGTVAVLLEAGADVTLTNNEHLTAAQIAERAEKPRIAAAIKAHAAGTAKPRTGG
jgi:ankyrin repeat protein